MQGSNKMKPGRWLGRISCRTLFALEFALSFLGSIECILKVTVNHDYSSSLERFLMIMWGKGYI